MPKSLLIACIDNPRMKVLCAFSLVVSERAIQSIGQSRRDSNEEVEAKSLKTKSGLGRILTYD